MDGEKTSVEIMMNFQQYSDRDYVSVCDFLIALNSDDHSHINWNWARFEWMAEHPMFDKSAASSIGLWRDGDRIVGAAIYDMYFGEAFCGALTAYRSLISAIWEYAFRELKDDNGLAVAVCDDCKSEIEAAKSLGFVPTEQTETMMRIALDRSFDAELPQGMRFVSLDPAEEPYDFQWLLWQGFDHGTDKAEFEREDPIVPQIRRHLDPALSLAVETPQGEKVAYGCLWYHEKTDYAYIEPVCVIPSYRGKGLAKALVFEALNRAKARGAKNAYVLSDMMFYEKLGFFPEKHFTFYQKHAEADRRN